MRLYLSSFRMGNCPERLASLMRGGRRVAVIANSTDAYPPEGRAEAVNRELAALSELGFAAEELDLRDHFDDPHVASELRRYDLIWARGGDVFTLRYSLAKSGGDDALRQLLAQDVIAYGGYSAGICVLAPTLRGLEEVDDPTWLRSLYDADPHWEGLGILDYCLVPHIDSPEHPESRACQRVADLYRSNGTPHRLLRDGEVLVIDGDDEEACA